MKLLSNEEASVQLSCVRTKNTRLLIEGSCYSHADVATIPLFTFSWNLSSLFMDNYSDDVLLEASSSYTKIMGTFPNQWFGLGCSMGCKTILMFRHLLFYDLKWTD